MWYRVVFPYHCFAQYVGFIFKGGKSKKQKQSTPEVGKIFFLGGGGLCPLQNVSKKHDILEAGSVSVFSQKAPKRMYP
jgi:hypothetical protein